MTMRTVMEIALVIGLATSLIGLHNVDNAWNLSRMETRERALIDCNSVTCMGMTQLYTTGITQTAAGIMTMAFSLPIIASGGEGSGVSRRKNAGRDNPKTGEHRD